MTTARKDGNARPGDPARRQDRRWPDVMALPATATPRSAAMLYGVLFIAGGGLTLALAVLSDGANAGVTVPLAVPCLLLGPWLLHRGRLEGRGVHAAAALCLALALVIMLSTEDPQLSAVYANGVTLLALVVVATCSWVHTALHVLAMVGALLASQLLDSGPAVWTALLGQVVVLLAGCWFAGFMVRAASAAEVDTLTGLPNRRGAERHLDAAVALAATGVVHSAAVIDLDHFKAVNDSRGHAAGDALLRDVARSLRSAVTAGLGSDVLVARWGGDEFVIAAPTHPERLAAAIDAARALLPEGASCSAGVAVAVPGDSPSRVLSRADQALYQVKRSVRGRTEVVGASV